jgi:hypothetical protein
MHINHINHITPQGPQQPSLCKEHSRQNKTFCAGTPARRKKSTEIDQSTSKVVCKEALGSPNGWSPREEEIDNVDMLDSFSPIGTINDTRNTQITSDKTFRTCAFLWAIAMLILVKIQGR